MCRSRSAPATCARPTRTGPVHVASRQRHGLTAPGHWTGDERREELRVESVAGQHLARQLVHRQDPLKRKARVDLPHRGPDSGGERARIARRLRDVEHEDEQVSEAVVAERIGPARVRDGSRDRREADHDDERPRFERQIGADGERGEEHEPHPTAHGRGRKQAGLHGVLRLHQKIIVSFRVGRMHLPPSPPYPKLKSAQGLPRSRSQSLRRS